MGVFNGLGNPLWVCTNRNDVVEWLKKKGSGYQTRINAILRSYMRAQSDEGADRRT
jgi:hypothetical protein